MLLLSAISPSRKASTSAGDQVAPVISDARSGDDEARRIEVASLPVVTDRLAQDWNIEGVGQLTGLAEVPTPQIGEIPEAHGRSPPPALEHQIPGATCLARGSTPGRLLGPLAEY